MAVTQAQLTQLYLAYFGRPPDFDGTTHYTANPNETTTTVAAKFSASPESQTLYGPVFGAAQINAIYQNLFNRDAEPAGLSYWATEVAAGRITPAGAALAILLGAQNADKTCVDNKIALSTAFYQQLDTSAELTGYTGTAAAAAARAFLRTVDATSASVTAAQTALATAVASTVAMGPVSGVPGTNFNLTINQDTLVGGSANDTFTAGIASDTAGNVNNTLQSFDSIDGGDGTDTLNVTVENYTAPTLRNVEIVKARFTNFNDLDLTNATGVNSVVIADSTANSNVLGFGAIGSVTVRNQNQDVFLGNNTATTLAVTFENFGTAANNTDLNLNAAVVTTVNVTSTNSVTALSNTGSVKNASFAVTGTNVIDLNAMSTSLETLTVTGSGSLNTGAATLGALKTLTAGVLTGNLTVIVDDTATSVTGGAGKDSVSYTAAIGATAKIDLGAGNDILRMAAATNAGATAAGGEGTDTLAVTDGTWLAGGSKIFSGFEVLEIGGGTGAYDMDQLTTLNSVSVTGAALTGATTINNAAAGTTLTISSAKASNYATAQDLTYALKTQTKTDTLSVTLNAVDGDNDGVVEGNVTVTKLTASGIETVSFTSNATPDSGKAATSYTNTITDLVVDAATTLNITGAANTVIGMLTSTTVTKVDASTATGAVTVDASVSAQAVTFLGGSGGDTFDGSAFGDTLNAGKGADALILDGGFASVDTIILRVGDSALTSKANGHDSITNFGTVAASGALDVIDVTGFAFTGSQRAVGVKGVLAATAVDGSTLSVNDFFDVGGVDRGVAIGVVGTDTWAFVDVNKDGNFGATDDLVIRIVGVTDVGNSNFVF